MMDKLNKHDVVVQAIKDLKAGQFKATAIKVELEAQLGRGGSCEGEHTCDECNGEWEDVEQSCNECVDGCEYCNGGTTNICQSCNEGYIECDGWCDGGEEWSTTDCHEWLMSKLEALGLSEQDTDKYFATSHGITSHWIPKGALKYAEFYHDGSVDSEFTFTLSLKNPENIFLLPEIVKVFTALADEIGHGIGVNGAGMHMALLNTKDCRYPGPMPARQAIGFRNFSKSMKLLLPALYFLGSSNGHSRGMGYRTPTVAMNTHRAAIDYRQGALEYRIFDTCYDEPDTILDNIVVIRNCMRFWRNKYKNPNIKLKGRVTFGNNKGYDLQRLYVTATHIEILNAGLKKLKPSYYSIGELKQQRKFTTTKHSLKSTFTKYCKQVRGEYTEYIERQNWALEARKYKLIATKANVHSVSLPTQNRAALMAEYEREAEREARSSHQVQPLEDYIETRVTEFNTGLAGDYLLA